MKNTIAFILLLMYYFNLLGQNSYVNQFKVIGKGILVQEIIHNPNSESYSAIKFIYLDSTIDVISPKYAFSLKKESDRKKMHIIANNSKIYFDDTLLVFVSRFETLIKAGCGQLITYSKRNNKWQLTKDPVLRIGLGSEDPFPYPLSKNVFSLQRYGGYDADGAKKEPSIELIVLKNDTTIKRYDCYERSTESAPTPSCTLCLDTLPKHYYTKDSCKVSIQCNQKQKMVLTIDSNYLKQTNTNFYYRPQNEELGYFINATIGVPKPNEEIDFYLKKYYQSGIGVYSRDYGTYQQENVDDIRLGNTVGYPTFSTLLFTPDSAQQATFVTCKYVQNEWRVVFKASFTLPAQQYTAQFLSPETVLFEFCNAEGKTVEQIGFIDIWMKFRWLFEGDKKYDFAYPFK